MIGEARASGPQRDARSPILIILLLAGCASSLPPSPLWVGLQPGRYSVGYRDGVWYPARNEGERLRFRDYVGVLDDAEAFFHQHRISAETVVDLFDVLMYARADAPPLDGHFPNIVIAASTPDQAVLGEFLASHGYVVRTGAGGRPPFPPWSFAAAAFPELAAFKPSPSAAARAKAVLAEIPKPHP